MATPKRPKEPEHPLELLIKLIDMIMLDGKPDPNSTHRHKCPKCRHVWKHKNSCEDRKKEHTCAKCGTEQWFKFYGKRNTHCAKL